MRIARAPQLGRLPLGCSLLVVAVLLCRGVTRGQVAAQVQELLGQASPAHPRLFVPAEGWAPLRARIESSALLRRTFAALQESADAILETQPIERRLTGRRLLSVSRTCLGRVTTLAFVHRLTGEARYARRAEREMLAAAAFADWNPAHFLDVAEMTAALAIGYDWLHAALSPEARTRIREAIVQKGLRPAFPGGWWVRTNNNWNQVCHGGLSLGALAVLEDEPELAARIVHRAVQMLPRAMDGYAPDGAYPEGPGYWAYGTSFNVLALSAFESVLGTDFGLGASRGFMESATYYLHVTGPTGLFFNYSNYSDCGSRGGVSPAMYWFAGKRGDASLLWHELRVPARSGTRIAVLLQAAAGPAPELCPLGTW